MRTIAMLMLCCAMLAGCATEHPGSPAAPDVQPPYVPPRTWTMPAPASATNVYHINIYCGEVRL